MSKKKRALELIKNIDWSELRNQKRVLLETINAEEGGNDEMLGTQHSPFIPSDGERVAGGRER